MQMAIQCVYCGIGKHVNWDREDGTYETKCVNCKKMFNFVVKNKVAYDWEPPKVTQSYKGVGIPGGS